MTGDVALENVVETISTADPEGLRIGSVFRAAFDYLYDGQRTGRYRPDQLSKTEKTHCGSLVEIYLRRALGDVIADGDRLDFTIAGHEIDCKFSFTLGAWMLPPECFGELLLVAHADDVAGHWSLGVVRAEPDNLTKGSNRDAKKTLTSAALKRVTWIFERFDLPPNALLCLPKPDVEAIFLERSGQKRVNELFRRAQLVPITRSVVATVAQQDDYMKRVRANGGARSALRTEGILIPGGDYASHSVLALRMGAPEIRPGEFISFRVIECSEADPRAVELDGSFWRIAERHEQAAPLAPALPTTRKA